MKDQSENEWLSCRNLFLRGFIDELRNAFWTEYFFTLHRASNTVAHLRIHNINDSCFHFALKKNREPPVSWHLPMSMTSHLFLVLKFILTRAAVCGRRHMVLQFVTHSHRTGFGGLVIPKPVDIVFNKPSKNPTPTFSNKMLSFSSSGFIFTH